MAGGSSTAVLLRVRPAQAEPPFQATGTPLAGAGALRPPWSVLVVREGVYVRLVKPVTDRLFAVMMLLLLAPLLCGLLLVVRLKLGAPAIFRQERVGRGSRLFTIYKVRTMLSEAPLPATREKERDWPRPASVVSDMHKSDTDPRHTPLGRVLRRLSLDELPQLWNVLRGDMSLVGPRPEMIHMVERNNLWNHPRHLARPGLTGAWQVSPDRNKPIHENLHHDLDYIARVTFLGDMKILGQTVGCVFGRRGA